MKNEIEISSKLNQALNRIESRLFTIKKQNVNLSTKAETYANVIKTITKMTKNENEKKKRCQKNNDDKYDNSKKKEEINYKSRKRS